MSGRAGDRSLVLAWAVGLGLCAAGALVTRAAVQAATTRGPGGTTESAAAVATATETRPDSAAGVPGAASADGGGDHAGDDVAQPVAVSAAAGETTRGAPPDINSAPPAPAAKSGSSRHGADRRAAPMASLVSARTGERATGEPRAATVVRPGRPPRDTLPSALAAALVDTLRRVLDRAVADSAFPGAFAVVGNHRGILAEYGAGHLDWAPSAVPDDSTLWDLASLTKVVGMTSAMMQLVERGKVKLDAPVQRYLPRWTGRNKERVTVRHLLTHTAGLPAWRPLYKEATSPANALALVYATELDTLPGVRFVYSDLGAILLGQIVEQVSGEPLDRYLARHVYGPLRMRDTRYRPDSALRERIAPTEIDPWRQRHLRGEVHDENAYALGGISGHAGLFSTGRDLARLARMYLNGGALDGARIVKAATIRRFTQVQDSSISRRALGWETPTGNNSGGHYMSAHAFGHTGFTGTSIWIDPDRDLFVILLTNRVNPTRQNPKIGGVRVALADAVVQTVVASTPSSPRP